MQFVKWKVKTIYGISTLVKVKVKCQNNFQRYNVHVHCHLCGYSESFKSLVDQFYSLVVNWSSQTCVEERRPIMNVHVNIFLQ